ncbi:hypothetical protein [Prosthecobacter sp.]|uniref:hypothetical protein n=1 Tax=Prosthecobacter sp. TaxID=1965333 RepID=UPI00378308A3
MKSVLFIAMMWGMSGIVLASTPLELSITKLSPPKLTVAVKNTSASRNTGMWTGGSWSEQIFHFEVYDKTGKAIANYRHQFWSYTGNVPIAYELKPGETRAVEFDLSDKEAWIQPEKVDLKNDEGLSFCAVLNQPLEVEAHRRNVFTGEVKSPRTSTAQVHGTGSCVEWNALPKHGGGPRFNPASFLESLGKLHIRQDHAEANLLECLDPNLPWNQAALICRYQDSASLLLPGAYVVTLDWDTQESLSNAEKLRLSRSLKLPEFGDGGRGQPGWAVASEVLPRLPARGLTRIVVHGPGTAVNRAFDSSLFLEQTWHLQRNGSFRRE